MIAGAEITCVSVDKVIVRQKAYAKVNLALGVVGKRPDGYHEVFTVMAPVRVYDLVSVSADRWTDKGDRLGCGCVRVSCPAFPDLPQEQNLAYKAAIAFMRETRTAACIDVSIDKRIPAEAGMGGGSSDAAAVLSALNGMVPGKRSLGSQALLSLAARLGADVPFLLGCNTRPPAWEGALCTGIGDRVRPVPVPAVWIVIIVPAVGVETRDAYRKFDEAHPLGAAEGADGRIKAFLLAAGLGDAAEMGRALFNDLEDATRESHPAIPEVKRRLLASGALGASMTGSGSAVFGIAASEPDARDIAARVRLAVSDLGVKEIIVTRTGVDPSAC